MKNKNGRDLSRFWSIQNTFLLCFAVMGCVLVFRQILLLKTINSIWHDTVVVREASDVSYAIKQLDETLTREMVLSLDVLAHDRATDYDVQRLGRWRDLCRKTDERFETLEKKLLLFKDESRIGIDIGGFRDRYDRIHAARRRIDTAGRALFQEAFDEYHGFVEFLEKLRIDVFQPGSAEQFVILQSSQAETYTQELFGAVASEGSLLGHFISSGRSIDAPSLSRLEALESEQDTQIENIDGYIEQLKSGGSRFIAPVLARKIIGAAENAIHNLEQHKKLGREVHEAGRRANPDYPVKVNEWQERLSYVLEDIAALDALMAEAAVDAMEKDADGASRQLWTVWSLTTTMALMLILLFFYLRSRVLSPVLTITERMSEIAAGVLDVQLPSTPHNDEIGRMIVALETFRQRARSEKEQDKMANIGKMASGLAHEINNALQPLLSMSEMLCERFRDSDPQTHEMAEVMLKNAKYARDIVRDLLAFSRKDMRERESVDAATVIIEALEVAAEVIPGTVILVKKGFAFESEPSAHATITANKTGLTQILINLFSNACHAMKDTGTITLETGMEELGERNVHGLEPGHYVTLLVTDTGSGMDVETMKSIFTPFFTTKEVGVGTGLGLPMIYNTVKEWGGRVAVDSSPGQGTTFKLLIPVQSWFCVMKKN